MKTYLFSFVYRLARNYEICETSLDMEEFFKQKKIDTLEKYPTVSSFSIWSDQDDESIRESWKKLIGKTKFFVIKEGALAYASPPRPNTLIILSLNGEGRMHFRDGDQIAYLPNSPWVRPAKKIDFENFRLAPGQYENDPSYDFPTE